MKQNKYVGQTHLFVCLFNLMLKYIHVMTYMFYASEINKMSSPSL